MDTVVISVWRAVFSRKGGGVHANLLESNRLVGSK